MTVSTLGDTAVVLELGRDIDDATLARVQAVADALRRKLPRGAVDVVPAFGSIAVIYDATKIEVFETFSAEIRERAEEALKINSPDPTGGQVEIPVCYDREFAPDLAAVAAHCRLSEAEVVARHSAAEYRVHAIGFVPGFPYLGGLPEELHMPRRATPRTSVPAGSVGIGGGQTGVYPLSSPGGWNLIGRTPVKLFSVTSEPPALLATGNRVRFRPISREEFAAWK